MQRLIMQKLIDWKTSTISKPLVLLGARQVGKTYLMKEFGQAHFDNYVYFNFELDNQLMRLFETTKDSTRLIQQLSIIAHQPITSSTLIIFDEIQECSSALNSLKYFNENSPHYNIIAAGSLLGVTFAKPQTYPVGQVDILDIYPLNFDEFLMACYPDLYQIITSVFDNSYLPSIPDTIHARLIEVYRIYLIIGGMPEAVKLWMETEDTTKIATAQENIIRLYENDFAKHNGNVNASKLLMIFRNIPSQLAKPNKKYIYGALKVGARAREYEDCIEWLVSSKLIHRVYCSNNNQYPIAPYDNISAFKLYLLDVGLLLRMSYITNESIIQDLDFAYKGAIAENYICTQLANIGIQPRYFVFKRHEVDFLIQYKSTIIGIEVKASHNTNSSSAKVYKQDYNPKLFIRYSTLRLDLNNTTLNIPLYLAHKSTTILDKLQLQ